jgi:hypothetical protein
MEDDTIVISSPGEFSKVTTGLWCMVPVEFTDYATHTEKQTKIYTTMNILFYK